MRDINISRDFYLNKLIKKRNNRMIKIVTGVRRCGKSYLLDPIFKNYLIDNGVDKSHIIKLELDSIENIEYREPKKLYDYVMEQVKDEEIYYIILDEIQLVDNFESVLNSFLRKTNLDVYVTGSNSKFLSSDVVTEFRGRGDEIRVHPLTFKEYLSVFEGTKEEAWNKYITYGGMPYSVMLETAEEKSKYLKDLFENTYLKDILERNNIKRDDVLDALVDMVASSVGSLTNPKKLADTFSSNGFSDVTNKTVSSYINYLLDSFLINKAERYDIKGKKYISTPSKYYFVDVGLRNARLNFRQQEYDHLMENVIYNELLYRGYNVDVGVVEVFEHNKDNVTIRKQLEIDFVCNQGSKRYYIQSAYSIDNKEKEKQEMRSLVNVNDFFKKIIIVKDDIEPWHNEDGVLIIGIKEFLLNEKSLDI